MPAKVSWNYNQLCLILQMIELRWSKYDFFVLDFKLGIILSPIIMVQWKMANYLKGNDPIGDTPIFDEHDYGSMEGSVFVISARDFATHCVNA